MLTVPDSFFKEENRIGFTVSEAMKRCWAVQLTMLDEILEIADKHGISVWLDYGTLLGAVRHHGYVPWDDDIDISVMRGDYLPLINYLNEELPPYRSVMSYHLDPRFNQSKAVILSRKTLDFGNNPTEGKITLLNYGFPSATWIDIFPMDYVPDDREQFSRIRELYKSAHNMALYMNNLSGSSEFEENLRILERITGKKLKRDENLRSSIWKLSEDIVSAALKMKSSNVTWYHDNINGSPNYMRPLSAYNKTLFVSFEFITVPIPAGYDLILRTVYGNNYVQPVRGTAAHDYPHFIGSERIILFCSNPGQTGDIF